MSPLVMTFMLALACGVMYWLSRFARKKLGVGAGTISPTAMKIVGKRMLEPRKALYVVELGNRYVLVGTAENSVSLIDHISAEEFESMRETMTEATPLKPLAKLASAAAARREGAATDAIDSNSDADASDAPGEQRFATVGESFNHFLDKARSSKKAKASAAAQHAAAAEPDEQTA